MLVLDTAAFLTQLHPDGEAATVPEVVAEVQNSPSRRYLQRLEALGMRIESPPPEALAQVEAAARISGDLPQLSETDRAVLALALHHAATLVSDDFAVQNVAARLGLRYLSAGGRTITQVRRWRWQCVGCRKRYNEVHDECPVCGAELRRRRRR